MHVFTAKWWKEPSPGVYVFDFEQNLSGWIKLMLGSCKAGTKIMFRHAELLQHPPYGPVDGNIYVGNLRGAKATDTYICNGNPEGEEWQPSFTQHGFRYVEVTGMESPPTLDSIQAINVRSAVAQTGSVSFSDPMLNNVQHNLLWGQATNLMMIPTDCDQRDERFGWTGDSALTSEEALSNFDLGAFYHNWAAMIDECSPNGAVDDTIPHGPGAGNSPASHSADASWGSVFPSIVWGLLKYNGDITVGKYWHGLTRFMDNEWAHIGNGTHKDITKMFAQFGDWCPPPPAGKVTSKFSAGFSFVNDIAHMVEVARHVGTAADVSKYQAILTASTKMFHDAWYVADKKYYADGGQTAQVLALQVNAPPDAATKEAVLAHLVNDIVVTHSNHTTCGIIGWRWELDILSANGYADVAYAIITQQTYPGYGYEILNEYEPATTVWELWDGDTQV
jgi:alpha-L-rhamnosidase